MSQEVTLKNLPLGINTLDKLRGSNCVYVDKTPFALKLIKQPGAFFFFYHDLDALAKVYLWIP